MLLIPLTQGQFAQVDDWNYDRLMEHKWYAHKFKHSYYAMRYGTMLNKHREYIQMHREIMQTPKDLLCDHRDRDGLNNLEKNLRNCNHSQNAMNKYPHNRNQYKGVSITKQNYIKGTINIEGINVHLGMCTTEEQAAKRYDMAALYYYEDFAYLNF